MVINTTIARHRNAGYGRGPASISNGGTAILLNSTITENTNEAEYCSSSGLRNGSEATMKLHQYPGGPEYQRGGAWDCSGPITSRIYIRSGTPRAAGARSAV